MVQQIISTTLGKAIKGAARLRGGGSALPGLIIDKVDPKFLTRTLNQLPMGVVVISGTNGKTTTTKVVVELLESAGLKVFTNRTGSNFSRGIVAALLGEVNNKGQIGADIAVLELDEAWAAKFVDRVKPRYSLLLNVLRDQLDRFGEIDATAKFLKKIADATTETVVLNRDDPRVFTLSKGVKANVDYFGAVSQLLEKMPTDDGLKSGGEEANTSVAADVLLESITDDHEATLIIDSKPFTARLSLSGIYNILNGAAALTVVRRILKDNSRSISTKSLIGHLSDIKPAFGRGEIIVVGETSVEILLVKNPSGFRLALLSFFEPKPTMIAINDNYADGRDMSWLWDVDFDSLQKDGVSVVSGKRAYDMALRLQYDEVVAHRVDTDIVRALQQFLDKHPNKPKRIYCTYTAMLTIRRRLAKIANVETVR